jgi:hypothetical protein
MSIFETDRGGSRPDPGQAGAPLLSPRPLCLRVLCVIPLCSEQPIDWIPKP